MPRATVTSFHTFIGGQNGNASGSGNATEYTSKYTTQRGEADPRRTARRPPSGGDPVPSLPAAAVPDRIASAGERRRRGRCAARRHALGVPQFGALRRPVAVFHLADSDRDQRGADAPEKREVPPGAFAG